MKVYRHRVVARFGLMHMIGTNLSVWLNVLVQETKHEILTFYNPENNSLRISHRLGTSLFIAAAARSGSRKCFRNTPPLKSLGERGTIFVSKVEEIPRYVTEESLL